MKKEISYSDLFFTFLKINAITFGGGYTIVPVIRDEFIHKKKLIDEEEMLNIVTLAQSGPGAMAISTSLLTGYRVKGFKGAITSLVASVLPPLVIITIVFFFYDAFKTNFWVKSALEGMAGVISAVLFITVFQMAKQALKDHKIFSSLLMIGAFTSSYFFQIHTVLIIITLALIGLVVFTLFDEKEVK
ncbi:MAG TPA: chromate transporter [Erysipelothrix sp.]|jgi:chromate transporter|nr:chromate transporter [Erysipelothrix sp.]